MDLHARYGSKYDKTIRYLNKSLLVKLQTYSYIFESITNVKSFKKMHLVSNNELNIV